uniref:Uncharacterized protein n=1 Tax=Romanomermis culicivorax TaxID=13658 RepID=A0A915JY08_ROMCU
MDDDNLGRNAKKKNIHVVKTKPDVRIAFRLNVNSTMTKNILKRINLKPHLYLIRMHSEKANTPQWRITLYGARIFCSLNLTGSIIGIFGVQAFSTAGNAMDAVNLHKKSSVMWMKALIKIQGPTVNRVVGVIFMEPRDHKRSEQVTQIESQLGARVTLTPCLTLAP